MKTLSFNRITIAAFAVFLSLFVISCQKENSLADSATPVTEEEATVYSDESAQAEGSFELCWDRKFKDR